MSRSDRDAKNNPVSFSGRLDTSQHQIGQKEEPRRLISDGDNVELTPRQIIVTDRVYDPEKMEMMQFLQEKITVRISPTRDKNAAPSFMVQIGNKEQIFVRGQRYTVPRYFIEHLMRTKETFFDNEEVINAKGERDVIHPARTALKFDFVIERDDNPKGRIWERAILAEQG